MDAALGETWYADTVVNPSAWPVLRQDLTVDVCVVGGGLAGLTAGYEFAKAGCSVVVLEADRIASQASGRNGGLVIPGFSLEPKQLIQSVGLVHAQKLWALSEDGVDYVRDTIAALQLPGVRPVGGLLVVRRTDNSAAAKADANDYTILGSQCRVLEVNQVRNYLVSDAYFQGVELPTAFHIHPLNYALGLANAVRAAGGLVFERSPAISFRRDRMRVDVGSDIGSRSVSASCFVFAQGAEAISLLRRAQQIMPLRTHVAVTEPLGSRLNELIQFKGAVLDTRVGLTYYRIVDGDRLLWGGPITFNIPPRQKLARMIRGEIAKDFPPLVDVELNHVWTGTLGFASHKMPVIDQIFSNVWQLSAFGGHGLNTTAMAGNLVAKAVITQNQEWRLFAPFRRGLALPRPIGRLAAYGVFLGYSLYDRFEEGSLFHMITRN
jgi:gamma-glutamylputrescine oxidase